MRQALHIFRKDVRRMTPELAMYGGLLVAFTVVTPLLWPGSGSHSEMLSMFAMLLMFLLVVSWLVLVTRLVHEESLVGDRQFWVTRPYRWTSLLGAKLLFVALCIVAPFAIVEISLVLRAGLELWPALPGLLLNLMYFVLVVLLPFTLLATMTGMISRTFLALTILVVGWAGIFALVDNFTTPRMMPPFIFETFSIVVAGLLASLLIYQYAMRHTQRTWRMFLLTTVFYFVLYFCCRGTGMGGLANALMRVHYPEAKGGTVSLAFVPGPFAPAYRETPGEDLVPLNLPVHYQDADKAARVQDARVSFTIDGPGYHYESPWLSMAVAADDLTILVPAAVFQRVRGSEMRLHLSVAAERLLPGPAETVEANDRFRVPDHGVCVLAKGNFIENNMFCRYPGDGPEPTRITGAITPGKCTDGHPTREAAAVIHPLNGGTRVDPVLQIVPQLGGAVCAGTKLTFTPYRSAGNVRLELDLPSLVLGQYIAH